VEGGDEQEVLGGSGANEHSVEKWRKTIGNGKEGPEGKGWGARALRARRRRISRRASGICADALGWVSWSSRVAPVPSALAASSVRLLHLLVLCSLLQVFIISAFSSHKQKSSTCIARYIYTCSSTR
jgi:hypothetical protein